MKRIRPEQARSRIHRQLRLEELEPRIAPGVAVAYVDDDYTLDTPGWGVDHFALIQDGIIAADTGGTVNVAAGVYNESVSLAKDATVTLSGAETVGSITISGGTVSASSCSLRITHDYSQSGGTFISVPTQGSFTVGGSFSLTGGAFNRFTGTGNTSGDPYLIYDVYGLQAVELNLSAGYKLANDVDASSTSNWNSGAGFEPVGHSGSGPAFAGSFDGGGHVISGLSINRPSQDFVGLFGHIGNGSSVANVGLVGGSVTGGGSCVGNVVGYMSGGVLSKSYQTGGVNAPNGQHVGGLVGFVSGGTLSGSYATGSVSGGTGGLYVGGLVGAMSGGAVSNCYAAGGVTGGSDVGGLMGSNGGTVSNSYAAGSVTGSFYLGGLAGSSESSGQVVSSYYDSQTTGQTSSSGGIAKTTAEMKQQTTFNGWDFTGTWAIAEGVIYPLLRGAPNAPILSIGNVSQLEGDSGQVDMVFLVTLSNPSSQPVVAAFGVSNGTATAGSDFASTSGTLTIAAGQTSGAIIVSVTGETTYEANEVFYVTLGSPIGGTLGTSQGAGTILDDDPLPAISVADRAFSEGNSGTRNVNLTVSLTNPSYQAVTVGYATSDGTATAGSDYTAGSGNLIIPAGSTSGSIFVSLNGDTVIEYDEVFYLNLSNAIGATLGDSQGVVTILNDDPPPLVYVDDDFSSSTPGWNLDHFAQISAGISAVSIGGTVNVDPGVYNETATLNKNAMVTLSGAGTVGSITISGGTVSALNCSLWITNDYSQAGGTFISSPTQGSFTVGGSFSLSGGAFKRFTGAGNTSGDPYLVYDVYGLQAMKLSPSAGYRLANDVDASSTTDWNSGAGFELVGGTNTSASFAGSFDGNGKEITGLYINRPSSWNQGLFESNLGLIENVGLRDVNVAGSQDVGALAGYNAGPGRISNCYATGNVNGDRVVGGLIGSNRQSGTVSNSYAAVRITGNSVIGGLAGDNTGSGVISNSYATGDVISAAGYYVGGLVGANESQGQIYRSYATGNVSGADQYVGGLAGWNAHTGGIANCYATGRVSGYGRVGGLVGYNYRASTISNSYATGLVAAVIDGGGLVGLSSTSSSVAGSYYDLQCTGQSGSAGGMAKTTAQMKQQATFSGWDSTNTWAIVESETYPFLRGEPNAPVLSIHDVSQPEGNTGSAMAVFAVTLSSSSSQPVAVQYATSNGVAAAGLDYTGTTGTLAILAGQTSGTIGVPILGDIVYEPDETLALYLSGPANATIGDGEGVCTILNDDGAAVLTITATDANASEIALDPGAFTVSRTGNTAGGLVVNYTLSGTASNGADYGNLSGAVTIGAGATSGTIAVSPMDDSLSEGNETVILTLSTSGSYVVGTPGSATVTITDNEMALVSGQVRSFLDGDGTTVTVTLTGPGSGWFNLTNGGTTGAGIHQVVLSGTALDSILSITTLGRERAGDDVRDDHVGCGHGHRRAGDDGERGEHHDRGLVDPAQ